MVFAFVAASLLLEVDDRQSEKSWPAPVATPTTRTTATQTDTATAPPAPSGVSRPAIVQKPIPFGEKRKQETAAYAQRH